MPETDRPKPRGGLGHGPSNLAEASTVEALEEIASFTKHVEFDVAPEIAREALPTARAEAEELATLKLRLKDAVTMGQRLEAQAEELERLRHDLHQARLGRMQDDQDELDNLNGQIGELAEYVMENVEGEPSQSQGAVVTAIRIMRTQAEELEKLRRGFDLLNTECSGRVDRLLAQLTKQAAVIEACRKAIEYNLHWLEAYYGIVEQDVEAKTNRRLSQAALDALISQGDQEP